ncbi:hypothetical protein CJF31_00011075 [Rutstroemia sp. NJR-2017a BVV2]|nr:hypothetical protein CJF31_00011075 [Rutstroemia sp. NJR-2017a BVV2]
MEAPATAPAAKKHQKSSKPRTKKSNDEPILLDSSPFVDNPKGDELKREVKLYDLLSSEDGSQRLAAAAAIISGLFEGDGVNQSTLQRHLERRLFRGLASGRKGARLGFSIVLTEILGQLFGTANLTEKKYPELTFDNVFGFLIAKTKPEGDLSGQEQKDHALGLLFGLQSFVRSKVLFAADGRWERVLEKLLELSNKKSWTREECGWVIMEALEQMQQKQAEFTLTNLCDAGLGLSPEGVGIWLGARQRFPDMQFPSKPWGQSGNPVDHLKALAKALKESSSSDSSTEKGQQANQTGTWNPKLHFVWNIVLQQYAKTANSESTDIKSGFENFWKVAVDDNLFSASASKERKFWGFLVFQKMIHDHISCTPLIASIFTHNLVRCLINHVQNEDRFLHRAADKSLKILIHAVEENPDSLPIILRGLIDSNGAYAFDRITKTKTIEKLLSNVNNENAETVFDALAKPVVIVQSTDDAAEAEKRRQIYGDYVLTAVRHTEPSETPEKWIKSVALPHLASLAYSKNSEAKPPVSDSTRTLIRNRLMSVFGHLLADVNGYHYPCDMVLSCEADAVAMDKDITDAKDAAISSLKKLLKKAKKEDGKSKPACQALALLFALVIIQLYNGDSEAVSILDELKLCYDNLIKHKSSGKDSKAKAGNADDTDAEPFDVLVELLLSLLSRPSALLRKVTQHVFTAFMGEMTASEQEDEDDSDADMTDSEMDALTPKLEEVLGRMQKKGPSKKQEQKDAKENMVNFKSRVLDLLDIFAKKQAFNPLAAQILIPLLQLIRTTKTKHLSDKAISIIQSFAKSKSKASHAAPEAKTDLKTQLALIKAIHEEVFKDQSKQFAKAASTASLSLASGLYKADESYAKKIGSIYLDTMNKTNKNSRVQQSFFTEWINWWASHPNPVGEAKDE